MVRKFIVTTENKRQGLCKVSNLEYKIQIEQILENRFLEFKPIHFVETNTPLDNKSLEWIVTKLKGRYCTYYKNKTEDSFTYRFDTTLYPAFEDPAEAVLYELRWS